MTEYELSSTLQGQMELIGATLMNFFTVLTAYLAAGYLVGQKLSLPAARFVTVMFVGAATFFIVIVSGLYTATKGLMAKMHTFLLAGKGLEWAPAAKAQPFIADIFAYAALALMVGGAFGAVYFFFHSRRADGNGEARPATTGQTQSAPTS